MSLTDRFKRAIARRFDGWFNTTTGVGAQNGRASMRFGVLEGEYLGLGDLENLYNFDGVCARVADAAPEHALRQGFTVSTGAAEEETGIIAACGALDLTTKSQLAWTWGNLFGGGALFLGANDGRPPEEPLDEANLRSLAWVIDVDRRDLVPLRYESDFDSKRFGEPVLYTLTRMGGTRAQSMTVHHSRIVRFEGVTPTRRRRLVLQGWGDSVLQRCYQEIMQLRGTFAASGELAQQSSQGVLKMKGLFDSMASDTDDMVKRRLALMDQSRSVARSILLDAEDEDFSRVDAGTLAGLGEIMDRMVNMVAGVTRIPATVLMGTATAGLSASEDPNTRTWYDNVAAQRTKMLEPKLRRVVRLMLLAKDGPTGGVEPAGWKIVFPSLWQLSPPEQADQRLKTSQADEVDIRSGVLTPEEVATSRYRKEGYSTDTSIDLEARQALMEADANGAGDTTGADAPDAGDNATKIAAVVAQVAGREIPRDAGVALLASSFGLTAEAADAIMGESGRTFFTTPEPGHAAEMDAVRQENAALKRSQSSTKAMLAGVLERNRKGELVIGRIIAGAPTDTEAGDVLEEGDTVAVTAEGAPPAAATDSRTVTTDAADDPAAPHVAIVLPLPAGASAEAAVPGGEPAAELHLTLAYLGRRVLTDDEAARITEVVTAWAKGRAPLPVTLGAVGRFTGTDPAKGDPIYRAVESVDLAADRDALANALDAAGFPLRTAHAYVPHVTLAYVPAGARAPIARAASFDVALDRACLWAGERRVEVTMGAKT